MGQHTYTISSAQSRLHHLVREAEEGRPIAIRRLNDTVAYIVLGQRLEAIVETMEILANPEARKAVDEHRAGKARFAPSSALDERRRSNSPSRSWTSSGGSLPSHDGGCGRRFET